MKNHLKNIWLTIIILICLLLAVLFFPVTPNNIGIYKGILFTAIGIIVVWLLFIIHSYIFTGKD